MLIESPAVSFAEHAELFKHVPVKVVPFARAVNTSGFVTFCLAVIATPILKVGFATTPDAAVVQVPVTVAEPAEFVMIILARGLRHAAPGTPKAVAVLLGGGNASVQVPSYGLLLPPPQPARNNETVIIASNVIFKCIFYTPHYFFNKRYTSFSSLINPCLASKYMAN